MSSLPHEIHTERVDMYMKRAFDGHSQKIQRFGSKLLKTP